MISKYDGLNKNLYDTSIPIRIQMKNQNETYNEGGGGYRCFNGFKYGMRKIKSNNDN